MPPLRTWPAPPAVFPPSAHASAVVLLPPPPLLAEPDVRHSAARPLLSPAVALRCTVRAVVSLRGAAGPGVAVLLHGVEAPEHTRAEASCALGDIVRGSGQIAVSRDVDFDVGPALCNWLLAVLEEGPRLDLHLAAVTPHEYTMRAAPTTHASALPRRRLMLSARSPGSPDKNELRGAFGADQDRSPGASDVAMVLRRKRQLDSTSCSVLPSLSMPNLLPPAHAVAPSEPSSPTVEQPRPMRRGSLPVRALPPLNFGNLKGHLPTANDLGTARRRLEAIGSTLSRFRPYLFVGGDAAARDGEGLRRSGITHVVNCAGHTARNYHEHASSAGPMRYLRLFPRDDADEDLSCMFLDVCDFIDEARQRGGACLVHCHQGISRSVTCAMAYVMMREGSGYDEAMRSMRECRPIADPNVGFVNILRQLSQRLQHGLTQARAYRVQQHAPHKNASHYVATWTRASTRTATPLELFGRHAWILERARGGGVVAVRGALARDVEWKNALRIARQMGRQEGRRGGRELDVVLLPQGADVGVEEEIARAVAAGETQST